MIDRRKTYRYDRNGRKLQKKMQGIRRNAKNREMQNKEMQNKEMQNRRKADNEQKKRSSVNGSMAERGENA